MRDPQMSVFTNLKSFFEQPTQPCPLHGHATSLQGVFEGHEKDLLWGHATRGQREVMHCWVVGGELYE